MRDVFRAKQVADAIETRLKGRFPTLFATDWSELNKPLWDALELEKTVYFIVLLLLILVASFSIVSTLVMVVMEKSRDIAVLKSLGAPDQSILRIFVLQGALIGLVGIALGTLMGYLSCVGLRVYGFPIDEQVFSLKELPIHVVPANFALVAGAALVITVLAGVYPATRAAKLRPAEALRYE